MKYKYSTSSKNEHKAQLHLIGIFNDKNIKHISHVNNHVKKALKNSIDLCNFMGELNDHRTFDDTDNNQQVIVFGLGDKSHFNQRILNRAVSGIMKRIHKTKITSISLNIDNLINNNKNVDLEAVVFAIDQTQYKYCHKPSNDKVTLKECIINGTKKIKDNDFKKITTNAISVSQGMMLAKDLGNTPPNICNPNYLLKEAKKLKSVNKMLKISSLDESKMKSLGMGSFLSVSRGSKQPAQLIVIEYMPLKNEKPIVLVGKGITFDTGGISLKPSAKMDEMKYDMSGAGSVMGVMKACAQMKLKKNVIGILACAENMPGSQASRPGDVVTTMSGITVEILNTDAEGRLVLCDALTYSRKFKPKYVIDIATLTGACLVGLGKYPSGLFSKSDKISKLIEKSSERTGDRVWRLPLYDDYFDEIKTNFADIQNIGGRYGGAITAAAFLAKFTEGLEWAHLDIAGTAWDEGANKGSTGRPVGLLIDFVRSN
jgi:leucyl aminopeptidase|tara:strand:- start:2322 stop:3779 length:1458 start_codon:yes stop_codon:yes gene_type:complete